MAVTDDLKTALTTLSTQIDNEIASHLAASSTLTAANDSNTAALTEALATVQALSGKLTPLPA